jgi:hypothetical protein
MNSKEFLQEERDATWPPALTALWLAEHGDWDAAHAQAQLGNTADGDWVHAHLHREEGDLGNARYWYQRCGKTMPETSISQERHELIRIFLNQLESSP